MPRTKVAARATDEDQVLAKRIGDRIRAARHRVGLTQQQLAGERYTKAYISALETGIARPSMIALSFISERLALPPSHFLDHHSPTWSRLEVDMLLAAGDWDQAAVGYRALLETPLDERGRAEVLRGLAEALTRIDRGGEAIAAAAESAQLFAAQGLAADAALARYWLAYGLYESGNDDEARSLLGALIDLVRGGLAVEPDFEMRLLVALAAVESRVGEHARSLAYLEEARAMATDLDDRRRATFLRNLAINYQATGDSQAAVRAGMQGLALYRAAGALLESASIQNDLAIAYLALGDVERAGALAAAAHEEFARAGDERFLSAVLETEARVALAGGKRDEALALAAQSRGLAHAAGNRHVELAAMLTEARAQRAAGAVGDAEEQYRAAVAVAREANAPARLREVLREWAELRAEGGDHRGAYELTNEALSVTEVPRRS